MPYGAFNSVAEIAKKFDLEVADKIVFIDEKKLSILDVFFSMVEENLRNKANYASEFAICDGIIRPILDIVVKNYLLRVWSHVSYNVDKEKGLIGEPDYLIATKTKYGEMARPSLCIIEAKKADFDEGWTQALAEMVASSLLGAKICYGIVTTGDFWQFGKLEDSIFTIDLNAISATDNLQRMFNKINWIFNEISE